MILMSLQFGQEEIRRADIHEEETKGAIVFLH
uniref:Uncharacterized protein n=1 Tax=Arundo donax TaxID=35708 RepID=A0A0A9ALB5_ARUDO